MIYELECRYGNQKSFYGKAMVKEVSHCVEEKNIITKVLTSYGTVVAKIIDYGDRMKYIYYGSYSRTTSRHQREFFMQNGLTYDEVTKLFRSRSGELET